MSESKPSREARRAEPKPKAKPDEKPKPLKLETVVYDRVAFSRLSKSPAAPKKKS